jgi:hypothetical protein
VCSIVNKKTHLFKGGFFVVVKLKAFDVQECGGSGGIAVLQYPRDGGVL